jgi:dTMP kinase
MAAMFVLDRIFHNVNTKWGIEKMLDDGYDVLCDRYYYSSLAYQGSETAGEWVRNMNLNCPEIRRPDICIFLDLTADESLGRIAKGRAVTEIYEKKEKLEAVRSGYLSVFEELIKAGENILIVDANRPIDVIAEEIFEAVKSLV